MQQAVEAAAPNSDGQAALPSHAKKMQQAANTAAAKLNSPEEMVRKSGGALAAPAAGFHPQLAADTAAVSSEGTEQAQTPTDTAPAAAVAVQQAAEKAAATLDGNEEVQESASTAPAAAAVSDPSQAAKTAAAKSNGQKKAVKPTGRAAVPAAMSAQKRAADTAASKLNSAGQQTAQSSVPPAVQLPSQAVPSRSKFHYERMFPTQTEGTYRGSSNAVPRQAEAKASRSV